MRILRYLCVCTLAVLLATTAVAQEAKKQAESESPKIQLAILLDTSGSMDGLIKQAQTQLWKIVNEFATTKRNGQVPELEVALYEYGKSSLPAKEGYLRQILPLTDDLDNVSAELFALKTNGGEEYCGWVIKSAVEGLAWSENDRDLKCIFIAGNEPFSQGKVPFKDACQQAIEKNITVNTIFCGPLQEGIRTGWQQGALLADGNYINIDQNQKVPAIQAPQDKKLAELSGKLNKTYVAFGKAEKRARRKELQKQQDAAAQNAAPAAGAARAAAKASGFYRNSTWDLIDAINEGKVKLADLKDEELPDELRKIKPEKRMAFLKEKEAERKQIKAEIKKLADEREAYVRKELEKLSQKGDGNTLDIAIIRAVREQAEKKDFEFEKK